MNHMGMPIGLPMSLIGECLGSMRLLKPQIVLTKITVCDRYLDYNEDIPEHEWIIDLWHDMYNRGLIEFENYVYDGDEWLEEPNASVELGDDCLWGSLKGLVSNPEWKSRIEDYI